MGCIKSQPMQNPKRDPEAGLSKAPKAGSQEFFRPRSGAHARKNCENPPFDLARRSRDDLQRIVATMQARKLEGRKNTGQLNPQVASSSVTDLRSGITDRQEA
jgi:hypothetical protein